MCVILSLFSALSRRVGALQISIIIITIYFFVLVGRGYHVQCKTPSFTTVTDCCIRVKRTLFLVSYTGCLPQRLCSRLSTKISNMNSSLTLYFT